MAIPEKAELGVWLRLGGLSSSSSWSSSRFGNIENSRTRTKLFLTNS